MKEVFPLSNGEIKGIATPFETAAETVAHQLRTHPGQFHNLEVFKQHLIGSENRAERLNGQRPWPAREKGGETWRYTIPVFAGFSDENTVLSVLKDPWHPHTDPDDWLVGQLHLPSGEYTEYLVTAVRADASNAISLQIADPSWYRNMPPGMRPGPSQPVRDWHRLSLKLDKNFLTEQAEIRYGLDGAQSFYEIEHLANAMMLETREYAEAQQPSTVNDILAQLALRQHQLEDRLQAA